MENKFKKGLILGGLLAVGAAVGMVMSKDRKGLTEELQQDLKVLAKHLKKNLHQLEDVTKEKFNELVITVVDEYAKKKELAIDAKKTLIDVLQSEWQEMDKEYLAEQDENQAVK
jgi:gas vesicle protein